jgi:ankyrin repeat protein
VGKQTGDVFYALTTGDLPTLNKMAASGWSLAECKDTAGKTALHRAAQLGNTGAIEILLKAGSKVDAKTTWKETPLHYAARNGRLPAVKQLVEAGAPRTLSGPAE